MTRLALRPAVHIDLADIEAWIARDSPRAALRVVEEIEAAIADLPHTAGLIAPRESLGGLRLAVVKSYVIAYRYYEDEDLVRVLRIVHGARDLPRVLSGS